MKVLIIGGTGTISTAVVREALQQGHQVSVLNRGRSKRPLPVGVEVIHADINNSREIERALMGLSFDVIAQFIAFNPEHIERDMKIFAGKANQYIYISSASAYRKPLPNYYVSESTALGNPFWDYSYNKQLAEERLQHLAMDLGQAYTIVRPSHTYDINKIPVGLHGNNGSFSVVKRIREGKPIIVHGDGESLWTFTFNEDFARGFVGLFGNHHAYGEAVHITSDESLTWNAAYTIIGEAVGRAPDMIHVASDRLIASRPDLRGPLLGDKAVSVAFDNRKIKQLVPSFRCDVRYDQGVRLAWANILKNPELQVEDPEFDAWCDEIAANEINRTPV